MAPMRDKVTVTVIDDRVRTGVRECPFKGELDATSEYRKCNVDSTSQPICVGADNENCLLRQYDRYVVERLP